jgi:hypothetical protein
MFITANVRGWGWEESLLGGCELSSTELPAGDRGLGEYLEAMSAIP